MVVIGAGAAGLFCAGVAGQRGLRVLLLDHAPRVAEKIRISGGGRCNFTNRDVSAANFISQSPDFCRSALAGYTPQDFIALIERHGITWHEKHKGQFFCDERSEGIIRMLLAECDAGGVVRRQPCAVLDVRRSEVSEEGEAGLAWRFELDTDAGAVCTSQLVVATGGLSIPKIGATDFGQRLAARWGHTIEPLRPALVPLTFDARQWAPWAALSGAALPVKVSVPVPADLGSMGGKRKAKTVAFFEDLLLTHRGLSGPAILQISTFWREGQPLSIDLAPHTDLAAALKAAKAGSRKQLSNAWTQALPETVPQRLAQAWLSSTAEQCPTLRPDAAFAELKDRDLDTLGHSANAWQLTPDGSEGYGKAEVTAGGVSTHELSSRTMESRKVPGLHFIGEVVDVTGWLGGYNFQWAWASAMACARALNLPAHQPR